MGMRATLESEAKSQYPSNPSAAEAPNQVEGKPSLVSKQLLKNSTKIRGRKTFPAAPQMPGERRQAL